MKIIKAYPPNIDEIEKVFPMATQGDVIFAYNNAIYNPDGEDLSEHLIVHETVHCERQNTYSINSPDGGDVEAGSVVWWHYYLTDPEFRYQEEILAHRAEYQSMIQSAINRNQRRAALKEAARKLSHRLYGGMTTKRQAAIDIIREN